jgi:hypothetical protein
MIISMNSAYNIIAMSIYNEPTFFKSAPYINYNNAHINTGLDVSKLVSIFAYYKFNLADLRNILYIYISVTGEDTYKIKKAIEYIKAEFGQKKYDELKKKHNKLQQSLYQITITK